MKRKKPLAGSREAMIETLGQFAGIDECGLPPWASKEEREHYAKMFKACTPIVKGLGKIVVFGTGGDIT